MYNKLRKLTIQDKFKVAKAIRVYPNWLKDSDIDDDWCKRVMEVITEDNLNVILNRKD